MIIRGSNDAVNLPPLLANKFKEQGWKWSAHTHPGDAIKHLQPSGMTGDRGVLAYLDQEQSLVLNSIGRRKVFDKTGDMDLDISRSAGVKSYEIN